MPSTTTKNNESPDPLEHLRQQIAEAEARVDAEAEQIRQEYLQLDAGLEDQENRALLARTRPQAIEMAWRALDRSISPQDYLLAQAEATLEDTLLDGMRQRMKVLSVEFPVTEKSAAEAVAAVLRGIYQGAVPVVATYGDLHDVEHLARQYGGLMALAVQTEEWAPPGKPGDGYVAGRVEVILANKSDLHRDLTSLEVIRAAAESGQDMGDPQGFEFRNRFTISVQRGCLDLPKVDLPSEQYLDLWCHRLTSAIAGSITQHGTGVRGLVAEDVYMSTHLAARADGARVVSVEQDGERKRAVTVEAHVGLRRLKATPTGEDALSIIRRDLDRYNWPHVPGLGRLDSVEVLEEFYDASLDGIDELPVDGNSLAGFNDDQGLKVVARFLQAA